MLACDDPETLENLSSYWLPKLRRLEPLEGKMDPPLELSWQMELLPEFDKMDPSLELGGQMELPPEFDNERWPVWKDTTLITQLIHVQEKFGPYRKMADKSPRYGPSHPLDTKR
ncbi:hypothetical protein RND81_04G006200 [Saponaria officinalis]|uniref:Uncharacterized protein n=1 Tax=Saponaria officinalis TaxID=3572 RepID=A0AAW1LGA6_SAPOF